MRWIYRAMAKIHPGMGQEQIDGMELWVIADAIFDAVKEQKELREKREGESAEEFFAESEDLGRQRAAFLAGQGPAPVAPPSPRVPIPAGMMEALQRRRAEKAAADGGDTGRGRA